MAKVSNSALVDVIRNKIGDTVFYRAYGQQLSRTRVNPTNTRTTARDTNRTRLADIATIWKDDLSEDERSRWREAARTIGPRPHRSGYGPLSGWQYFHNVNLVLENIGVGTIIEPPTRQTPDPVLTVTVNTLDATAPSILLDVTGAEGPNTHLIVYATRDVGPGVLSVNGTTRQIATFAPGATRPLDVTSAWTSKFGTLTPGERINFQVCAASGIDGQLTPRMYATSLITGGLMPNLLLHTAPGVNIGVGYGANNTAFNKLSGDALYNFPASWKIRALLTAGSVHVAACKVLRTLKGSTTVIDSTAVTFGGSATPTLSVGETDSDPITLTLDSTHDYWVATYIDTVSSPTTFLANVTNSGFAGGYASGDHTADSTIPVRSSPTNTYLYVGAYTA